MKITKRLFLLWMSMMLVLVIGRSSVQAELTPEMKKEIDEYMEKKQAEEGLVDKLLTTKKGGKFSLGGELEYEYVDVQNGGKKAEPHFVLDKFVLQPKVNINEDISIEAQLYFQPHNKTSINEFHIMFKNIPCKHTYIDAGLFEREIKNHSHRITEGYPLVGTAFWRDDEYALSLGGEWKSLYGSLLVGDGLALGEKQVAEDSSYKIIHDNKRDEDFNGLSEFNANFGYRNDYGKLGKVDVLLFYVYKELSDSDIEFLMDIPGYEGDLDDKSGFRRGFGADYSIGGLRLYGQYIEAEDGELKRSGWYIQPSYKVKLAQREYFNAFEVVFRYGELDMDVTPDPADSRTWDRDKIAIALISDICKNVKLKTEYYVNDEDTGAEDVDNDEFLTQLEVKF